MKLNFLYLVAPNECSLEQFCRFRLIYYLWKKLMNIFNIFLAIDCNKFFKFVVIKDFSYYKSCKIIIVVVTSFWLEELWIFENYWFFDDLEWWKKDTNQSRKENLILTEIQINDIDTICLMVPKCSKNSYCHFTILNLKNAIYYCVINSEYAIIWHCHMPNETVI